MEYFVTGATGFLGTRLVDQLLEADHDVVALVRSPESADLPADVAVVEGDLTDRESMRQPMAGVDGVFHLAAWYRVGGGDQETARRVNVGGTRNVLELMSELDVPKGVYTSSLAVFSDTEGRRPDESYRYDGPHLTAYDRTKWRAHYEVAAPMMADGLPLVVVMPGVVYGPGDAGPTGLLWDAYFDGKLPVISRKTGFCWGHVDDTARAHRLAMNRGAPGEDYIVAGEPRSLVEAFAVVAEITGRSPQGPYPRGFSADSPGFRHWSSGRWNFRRCTPRNHCGYWRARPITATTRRPNGSSGLRPDRSSGASVRPSRVDEFRTLS